MCSTLSWVGSLVDSDYVLWLGLIEVGEGKGVKISLSNLFNYLSISGDSKQMKKFPQKCGTLTTTRGGGRGGWPPNFLFTKTRQHISSHEHVFRNIPGGGVRFFNSYQVSIYYMYIFLYKYIIPCIEIYIYIYIQVYATFQINLNRTNMISDKLFMKQ